MSIAGIKRIAIFNDDATAADYGTVVQMNHVEAEGEFYTNGLGSDMASGIELHAGDESLGQFGFADKAGFAQLKTWQDADTLLKLVVAGLQDNGLWYQAAAIKVVDQSQFTPGNRSFAQLTIDDDTPDPDIWRGINLLQGVAGTEVLFPVKGITLTASADGGTGNLEITALDVAGATLATDNVAAGSRASVSLTLPANTYSVQVTLPTGATEPALRTDGSDQYVEA